MSFGFRFMCFYHEDNLSADSAVAWPERGFELDPHRGIEFSGGRRFFITQLFVCPGIDFGVLKKAFEHLITVEQDDFCIIAPFSMQKYLIALAKDFHVDITDALQQDIPLLRSIIHSSVNDTLETDQIIDGAELSFLALNPDNNPEVIMTGVLQKIKDLQNHQSEILGRNDFTYKLMLELVRAGGVKSLESAAKQFLPPKAKITAFRNNMRAYYHYGDPFMSIGLARSEWPLKLIMSQGQPEMLEVTDLEALVAGFSELGEDVPPVNWEVNGKDYSYGTIVSLTRDKSARMALADPFRNFFKGLPKDAIKRKPLTIDTVHDPKAPQVFSVIGRSWQMLVMVCIGPKNLDYAAGKREVVSIWEIMRRREREDRFIKEGRCFSLLICREFSKMAREAAGRSYDRVVLMTIADFIRLADFVDSLDGKAQQLAIFGLFKLEQIGASNSWDLVESYKEIITESSDAIK